MLEGCCNELRPACLGHPQGTRPGQHSRYDVGEQPEPLGISRTRLAFCLYNDRYRHLHGYRPSAGLMCAG